MMMRSVNNDPDNLECYSDHDHDVLTKGACDWCGSDSTHVTGHVLPDVERFTGKDPVAAAAIVLHTRSAKIFDGVLLDWMTAQAIHAVAEALSPGAKEKLRAMDLPKAGAICWKLVK